MRRERRETVIDVVRDVVAIPDSLQTEPQIGEVVESMPDGIDWRFEPDWDGLGVIARLGPGTDRLLSDRGRGFDRFFPEVAGAVVTMPVDDVIVRGSLVVVGRDGLEFAVVRQRLHPSPTRVATLAAATPATLVLTDIVVSGTVDLRASPIAVRRLHLERLANELGIRVALPNLRHILPGLPALLTPQTFDRAVARAWLLDRDAAGRDGVIARHADGQRWVRVRRIRTAACVATGFRRSASGNLGAVRLGLYDGARLIDVGRTIAIRRAPERRAAVAVLANVRLGATGPITTVGQAWVDVLPYLVCEVRFDRLRGKAFRHAVELIRWLPDRDPLSCTVDQLAP
ncbi:MAG: hypothetical protein M3Q20_02195 [Actinomycetota bacterium]|nr:hypothetical protein [Actinomycetota bacterium]